MPEFPMLEGLYTADDLFFQRASRQFPPEFGKDELATELIDVATAFRMNMIRVCALVDIAPQTASWIQAATKTGCQASLNLYGNLNPPDDHPESKEAWSKEHHKLMKERRVALEYGYNVLNGFARMPHEGIGNLARAGIEAILASQIINSWAAFEILAKDLWKDCLNKRPTIARSLVGRKKGKENDRDRSLSLNVLSKYGLNLEGQMGSILIAERIYDFTTLDDIGNSYEDAFEGILGMQYLKEEVFSHETVRAASAIRHVMMHNGGIADTRFRDQVKGISLHGISAASVGSPLKITGQLSGDLYQGIFTRGAALLKSISVVMARL